MIILKIWLNVITLFICSYLKKSNENLEMAHEHIVIKRMFFLFLNLLHIINIKIKVIVSNSCTGNKGILRLSGYVTENGPLYGIP